MKTIKVVLNKCFGGFGLSPLGIKRYQELKGEPCYFAKYNGRKTVCVPFEEAREFDGYWKDPELTQLIDEQGIERDDPALVQVVEELGDLANGDCAKLVIEEIPIPNINDLIEEYDGKETIRGSW